eukprot:TRINITY_DN29610_c0_g1_i1.p1 TRINITY_DN29610_c0_g1~~TRINITY_DN29610_c0_g1_i1.p1  ORF type:complete len:123 (-),score=43.64 TRINITY_DN29610_c0_g1_i1:135-503(-)
MCIRDRSKKKEKEEEEEVWKPWALDPEVMLREPVEMQYKMIQSVMEALNTAWDANRNAQGEVDFDSKGQQIVGDMRKILEEKWDPTWHVVAGRNFGSAVTYQSNHFLCFSKHQIHFLVIKTV